MARRNREEGAELPEARLRWTASEGRRALAAWRASGLCLSRFAQEHGLTAQRIDWWRRRLEEPNDPSPRRDDGALVPVVVAGRQEVQRMVGGAVTIELGGKMSIHVGEPSVVEPQWLAQLIGELNRSCG